MNHSFLLKTVKQCLWFSVFLIFLWLTGCQSKNLENRDTDASETEQQSAQTSGTGGQYFCLKISKGGGFTGLYTGYNLYQGGKIESWQRFASGKDSVLWTSNVTDSVVTLFKDQLLQLGVTEKKIQKSGNLMTQVKLELPDTTYLWFWSQANEPGLNEWVNEVEQYCREIKTK